MSGKMKIKLLSIMISVPQLDLIAVGDFLLYLAVRRGRRLRVVASAERY